MVPRQYRQPPPVYPYGKGFVAPVRPPLTPWLHPHQEIQPLPHETPLAQVPAPLPPALNTPTAWENPFFTPSAQPIPLAQTPVFPNVNINSYENAAVHNAFTPYFSTGASGFMPLPTMTPATPGFMPLPTMSPAASGILPLPSFAPGTPAFSPFPLITPPAGPYTPLPGMSPVSPGIIPLENSHLLHSPGIRSMKPGVFPPQESHIPVPLQLNPKLIYNPMNPGLPVLEWDVSLRPSTALTVTGRHCYVPVKLEESALSPDAQEMVIESDHPGLQDWMRRWGPIIIRKDTNLTIEHVLQGIYDYLQQPLTEEDTMLIRAGDEERNDGRSDWHALEYARYRRCQDGPGLYRITSQQGFKRVDVLGGNKRFKGLRYMVFATNQWKAYLGLLDSPEHVVKPF